VEERVLRAVRIIASMPKELAIEVIERTDQIERARK
jgi:hypothetical protein